MGFRRRGEAGEDALKDAENELRRGRSGEEARGDEKEVVAIVGWVWRDGRRWGVVSREYRLINCY